MEESLTASSMYDLIVSLSPLFDNFVEDLDFPCSTNLFGFEEISGAELAALREIIEAAEDAAAAGVDDDNLFQMDTNVGFGGGFPHLARMAENPDMGSETK